MTRLRSGARFGRRTIVRAIAQGWRPHSRLFFVTESAPWVTAREGVELTRIAHRLGIRTGPPTLVPDVRDQCVFHVSQFDFFTGAEIVARNRLAVAYYHGRPGTPGMPEFDRCYDSLRDNHERINRVQVTHSEMRDVVLSSGISAEKVFMIPIGINLDYFPLRSTDVKRDARDWLGIPQSAVVIGSLQKDGIGWGEGMEPKLIKGPDLFLETMALLKPKIKELYVLAAGPARGYLKAGLDRLEIPYLNVFPNPTRGVRGFDDVGRMYAALDLYVIASRQEGGPKAVLESMASGVPLVTTRVGHAMDVVRHGENGWMTDVEDVEGLAHWAEYALDHPHEVASVVEEARLTAEANSYEAQLPLWRDFMSGFVTS